MTIAVDWAVKPEHKQSLGIYVCKNAQQSCHHHAH